MIPIYDFNKYPLEFLYYWDCYWKFITKAKNIILSESFFYYTLNNGLSLSNIYYTGDWENLIIIMMDASV